MYSPINPSIFSGRLSGVPVILYLPAILSIVNCSSTGISSSLISPIFIEDVINSLALVNSEIAFSKSFSLYS